MTDREKMIELLRDVQYLGGLEEKIADHLLANGVTISDCIHDCKNCWKTQLCNPKWIPVTEKYPDVCGFPVLVVAVNRYGQRKIVKGFTDYECPVDFLTNEKEFDNCWHMWKVTHWMPLPEPPKGDSI